MIAIPNLRLVTSLASLAGLALLSTPVAAGGHGSDDAAFCRFYAERAVGQYQGMRDNSKDHPSCHVDDSPRWQPHFDNHFGWCMANIAVHFGWMASEDEARSSHMVKNCFDVGGVARPAPGSPDPAKAPP